MKETIANITFNDEKLSSKQTRPRMPAFATSVQNNTRISSQSNSTRKIKASKLERKKSNHLCS
jgi:hypothetical protein